MSVEMLEVVGEINANANRLVGLVAENQWAASTPCTEWTVKDLVNHMAGTSNLFAASASRTQPGSPPDADHLGDDAASSFASATAAADAAWRCDGALDGMVSVPAEMPAVACLGVNIIDIGTHCWDLAQAIGADHGLTASQIAMIDHWNRQVVSDDVRAGGGFGAVLEPESDDAMSTMLAFVGRRS